MVKKKKTIEQEMSDIATGKTMLSARSRKAPAVLNPSSGINNNNIANKINNNKKNHNTKKKKTPSAAKSTMNAINRAGNSSKPKKRSRAQQRSPHISDDDDNDNVDDYHQSNSSIVIVPPPISVPPIPVPALRPAAQPASNTTTDVSIYALSQVPKDMGLDNTVDEMTRELSQFLCRIDNIEGGLYGSDTDMINNLTTNCKEYDKAKLKVCSLHLYDFKYFLLTFFSQ